MKKHTRVAFDKYAQRLAQLNDTASVAQTFGVDPSIQQKLETKIQESSEFLGKINVIGVTELEGDKLGLGISGPIAGRTNTDKGDRKTRDLASLDDQRYRCEKTNFDTHIKYQTLDAWAKFPDFQQRIANVILQRQALDRMVIGFHGTSVAADTLTVELPPVPEPPVAPPPLVADAPYVPDIVLEAVPPAAVPPAAEPPTPPAPPTAVAVDVDVVVGVVCASAGTVNVEATRMPISMRFMASPS